MNVKTAQGIVAGEIEHLLCQRFQGRAVGIEGQFLRASFNVDGPGAIPEHIDRSAEVSGERNTFGESDHCFAPLFLRESVRLHAVRCKRSCDNSLLHFYNTMPWE